MLADRHLLAARLIGRSNDPAVGSDPAREPVVRWRVLRALAAHLAVTIQLDVRRLQAVGLKREQENKTGREGPSFLT